jgi:hypothetical protein
MEVDVSKLEVVGNENIYRPKGLIDRLLWQLCETTTADLAMEDDRSRLLAVF